ncbi:MAG TPA: RimK/LysX family protein, partial [Hyphomicrobiaceae bacterium]|nr:RimK/LysX family protein [Hyphomicrobiaceae bacterium]
LLGLPAIKAKVDTGARTSALHAHFVEPYEARRNRRVRFGVHPIARRADIEIVCTALVVDERTITSSNGDREKRYVISTPIRIGDREWEIEVTLTNRDAMSYRMLIGRQAISGGVLVDPATSFRQPRLRYKLYEAHTRG